MNTSLWKCYAPTESQPWNIRRVIHLHRRCAFGANWEEIQRDLRDGPEKSVDRLLDGAGSTSGNHENAAELSRRIRAAALSSGRLVRIQAWWLLHMLKSPDPLRERMTLMWHNHFATGNRKVKNLGQMLQQNDLLRKHALGGFAELLNAVLKDPAVLIWLDAQANRKERPNENLSRELLELFTIGVGNYSEGDVKDGARALTGWTVNEQGFYFDIEAHDDGEKTILNQTGRWDGDDFLRLLVNHPATSLRIASRICELLMGEGGVDDASINELAAVLRENDLDIAAAVEKVLRSEAFFHSRNIGSRPLAPVEYVLGAVRMLEMFDPMPSTMLLAEWCNAMGQEIFEPPSVFGWPGGRSWLTTRTLIARTNFAHAIVNGKCHRSSYLYSRQHLQGRIDKANAGELCDALNVMLTNGRIDRSGQAALVTDDDFRAFVSASLASAQAQLG